MTMKPQPARSSGDRRDRGQILPIFAIAVLSILAFVGLAVDGGSAFVQRRVQQAAADLAALAAANDYLINGSPDLAIARARDIAAENGFVHGSDGTVVDVALDTSNGIEVAASITAGHQNLVLGVIGMGTWEVSVDASALAGFPDTAHGAGPFIFSVEAFEDDGTPRYLTPTDFGEGNSDVPQGALDTAWTNYGTGNVNTNEVRSIIQGEVTMDEQLDFGEYIGQQNQGNHTDLYQHVDEYMSGQEFPVAVVDGNGNFAGWATFHVVSADPGNKQIRGYFVTSYHAASLSITACAANDCPRYFGSYVLKLID